MKASAAERYQQATAELDNDDTDITDGSHSFHISSVPTATGEQEFVRINDGVQVYGTEVERAASDVRFFESVRRGDYHTGSEHRFADEQNPDDPVESNITDDLTSLDIRTSDESGRAVPDGPVSVAETENVGIEVCAGVSSL